MSTTKWDGECEVLHQEKDLSAERILHNHGFNTLSQSQSLCQHFNLHTLEDISDLTTDFYEQVIGLTLPEKNRLAILVQKCRLVEGHAYIVRFDMKRSAKDLLYMYGLTEAYHISERLKLKTFADLANLTSGRINGLDIDDAEKIKLTELCLNCSDKATYASFSLAQASNIRKYANERIQIERQFFADREDRVRKRRASEEMAAYAERRANSQKAPKYPESNMSELLCQLHASIT
jgi:hypothetical protein